MIPGVGGSEAETVLSERHEEFVEAVNTVGWQSGDFEGEDFSVCVAPAYFFPEGVGGGMMSRAVDGEIGGVGLAPFITGDAPLAEGIEEWGQIHPSAAIDPDTSVGCVDGP